MVPDEISLLIVLIFVVFFSLSFGQNRAFSV